MFVRFFELLRVTLTIKAPIENRRRWMQDEASVKKAYAELSGMMGTLSYFEGLGFFPRSKRCGAQTLAPRFLDNCGALDPCRPEGTQGVRAFKTQLLRAKKREYIYKVLAEHRICKNPIPQLTWNANKHRICRRWLGTQINIEYVWISCWFLFLPFGLDFEAFVQQFYLNCFCFFKQISQTVSWKVRKVMVGRI